MPVGPNSKAVTVTYYTAAPTHAVHHQHSYQSHPHHHKAAKKHKSHHKPKYTTKRTSKHTVHYGLPSTTSIRHIVPTTSTPIEHTPPTHYVAPTPSTHIVTTPSTPHTVPTTSTHYAAPTTTTHYVAPSPSTTSTHLVTPTTTTPHTVPTTAAPYKAPTTATPHTTPTTTVPPYKPPMTTTSPAYVAPTTTSPSYAMPTNQQPGTVKRENEAAALGPIETASVDSDATGQVQNAVERPAFSLTGALQKWTSMLGNSGSNIAKRQDWYEPVPDESNDPNADSDAGDDDGEGDADNGDDVNGGQNNPDYVGASDGFSGPQVEQVERASFDDSSYSAETFKPVRTSLFPARSGGVADPEPQVIGSRHHGYSRWSGAAPAQ